MSVSYRDFCDEFCFDGFDYVVGGLVAVVVQINSFWDVDIAAHSVFCQCCAGTSTDRQEAIVFYEW